MTKYAVSTLAINARDARHTVAIIEAVSVEEAEGKALKIARKI